MLKFFQILTVLFLAFWVVRLFQCMDETTYCTTGDAFITLFVLVIAPWSVYFIYFFREKIIEKTEKIEKIIHKKNNTSSAESDYASSKTKKSVKFEELTFDVLNSEETRNNYERLDLEYHYKSLYLKSPPGVYWSPGWSEECRSFVRFAVHVVRKPKYEFDDKHLNVEEWGIIHIRDTVDEWYHHNNGVEYDNHSWYVNIDQHLFNSVFDSTRYDTSLQTPTMSEFTKANIFSKLADKRFLSKTKTDKKNSPEPDSDRKPTKNNNMDETMTPSEIKQKVNFYEKCSEELKKWADLRDSSIITEEEYQEKKEKGQYVKNALSSISFVVELIYNTADIGETPHIDYFDKYALAPLKGYDIPTGGKVKSTMPGVGDIPEKMYMIRAPQHKLAEWAIFRNSKAITEEEYQKLKEEFLKVEGVNKESDITEEIKAWSTHRDLNGITEEEFQKLKGYLLSTK